jgi:hypothetical protein
LHDQDYAWPSLLQVDSPIHWTVSEEERRAAPPQAVGAVAFQKEWQLLAVAARGRVIEIKESEGYRDATISACFLFGEVG